METLNATEVKREFDEILLKAQKEPLAINKNGKPVAVIVSAEEYEHLSALKEQWLQSELQRGLDDLQAGRVANGQAVLDRLRKRVRDAVL